VLLWVKSVPFLLSLILLTHPFFSWVSSLYNDVHVRMADPVSLTLGVVSLGTALSGTFVSVVQCFEYMQLGRRFDKDFGKSQVQLEVLKLRITRTGVSIGALADPDTGTKRTVNADKATVERAQELLEIILQDTTDMENKSKRYRGKSGSASEQEDPAAPLEMDPTIKALTSKVAIVVAKRLRGVPTKMKWVLFDKNFFDGLLQDVARNLNELEKMFEEKSVTQVTESQHQLSRAEVEQITDGLLPALLKLFHDASKANGDALLEKAVGDVIASRGAGHTFEGNNFDEEVTVQLGDRIADGYTGQALVGRIGHHYSQTTAKGKAKIRMGDTYGLTDF
jgi:hypothetical protein